MLDMLVNDAKIRNKVGFCQAEVSDKREWGKFILEWNTIDVGGNKIA